MIKQYAKGIEENWEADTKSDTQESNKLGGNRPEWILLKKINIYPGQMKSAPM